MMKLYAVAFCVSFIFSLLDGHLVYVIFTLVLPVSFTHRLQHTLDIYLFLECFFLIHLSSPLDKGNFEVVRGGVIKRPRVNSRADEKRYTEAFFRI